MKTIRPKTLVNCSHKKVSYDSSMTSLTNSNSLSPFYQFSTHILLLVVPIYFFIDKTKTKQETYKQWKHSNTCDRSTQKASITHYSIQSHKHKLVYGPHMTQHTSDQSIKLKSHNHKHNSS